jgi:hypothetical protein
MRHVIEIISAANTPTEMADKRAWYSRYCVEEYLVFHPETGLLEVFIRTPLGLSSIDTDLPWTSTVLERLRLPGRPRPPPRRRHLRPRPPRPQRHQGRDPRRRGGTRRRTSRHRRGRDRPLRPYQVAAHSVPRVGRLGARSPAGQSSPIRHPAKPGTVTVSGKLGRDMRVGTMASVFNQAGLRRKQ